MTIFSKFLPNSMFSYLSNYWADNYILGGIIGVTWGFYLWELYLVNRQRNVYKTTKNIPKELEGVLSTDTFEKSRRYKLELVNFSMIKDLFSQCESTLLLSLAVTPLLWKFCGSLMTHYGFGPQYEITQSTLFTLFGLLFSTITSLPWDLYDTFVIEQKYGFNKQTWKFYVKDQLKHFALTLALGLPIQSAIIYIIKTCGKYFYIYVWVFCVILVLVIMTIYPTIIAPMFDKFTPLEEGELRQKIEHLASQHKFPLKKIFVVEGSKRSSHSNAYMYGFFNNKRIVLFDTLLPSYYEKAENNQRDDGPKAGEFDGMELAKEDPIVPKDAPLLTKDEGKYKGLSNEEIVAVLAHELGHWKLHHVLKNLVISETNMFAVFMAFSYLNNNDALFKAFGFYDEKPIIIGLMIIFGFVFQPYQALVSFLTTVYSRKCEFDADSFATGLGFGSRLKSGLIKLLSENLTFPVTDKLYSTWHYSHPPLLERLSAIESQEQMVSPILSTPGQSDDDTIKKNE